MVAAGLLELRLVAAFERLHLTGAQAVARVQQQVEILAVAPRQLVDRPGGDGRALQLRDLGRPLPVAGLAQLAPERVAARDELVQWLAVELGDLLVGHAESVAEDGRGHTGLRRAHDAGRELDLAEIRLGHDREVARDARGPSGPRPTCSPSIRGCGGSTSRRRAARSPSSPRPR